MCDSSLSSSYPTNYKIESLAEIIQNLSINQVSNTELFVGYSTLCLNLYAMPVRGLNVCCRHIVDFNDLRVYREFESDERRLLLSARECALSYTELRHHADQ